MLNGYNLSRGLKFHEPKSYSWAQNVKIIMDAGEANARKWVKRKSAESDCLSERVKSITTLVKNKIHILSKYNTH